MNTWLLISAAAVLLATVVVSGYPYPLEYPGLDDDFPSYDADPKALGAAMDHHKGGGGGGGHKHGKATSYQVSNNWAYHPVKVYAKHHGHHDAA